MDAELQKFYSPSQWNKRFTPEKVIEVHLDFMSQSLIHNSFASIYDYQVAVIIN